MYSQIKYLFFDLDHTLWDFETNSNETLNELYLEHELEKHGLFDFDLFMQVYTKVNHGLWDEYNRGLVSKNALRDRRFKETFENLGLSIEHHPITFSDQYIDRCTLKPAVFPNVHETLHQLKAHYPMLIITNGFPESQHKKMKASSLDGYFDTLIISEEVGFAKPHRGIFEVALQKAGVAAHEALMIGDNLHADIQGATEAGIPAIWFNPKNIEHNEASLNQVQNLKDLLHLPGMRTASSQL